MKEKFIHCMSLYNKKTFFTGRWEKQAYLARPRKSLIKQKNFAIKKVGYQQKNLKTKIKLKDSSLYYISNPSKSKVKILFEFNYFLFISNY